MLDAFEIFSYFIALIYSGIWVPEFFTATDEKIEPWSFVTTATLAGLLTVYIGFLALGDFQKVFYLCHGLGTVSALWLIFKAYKKKLKPEPFTWSPTHTWVFGLASLIGLAIVFTGISDWQARSVWYFQAKILHNTHSLSSEDWFNPALSFLFPAFPKLYPVTIAFLTSPWAAWNEYAPKWSVLVLMIPVVTSLFSLKVQPSTLVLLFLAFTGISGESLWNGSPDAYVAIYFALGLLNFAIFFKTTNKIHMLQGLLFLGIIPSMHPDGWAMAVCFAMALSLFSKDAGALVREKNVSKFLLIPVATFAFWHLRKMEFHITDSLLVSRVTVDRMISRLIEIKPFLQLCWNTLLVHLDLLAFLGLIFLYFCLPQFRSRNLRWIRQEDSWILISAGLYFIFLFLIYWATPFHLEWYKSAHLPHAALVVKFALIAYVALGMEPAVAKAD